jgi:hypothetical protein
MLPTVSATIAGIALVVSVIVFFENRRRAAEAARLARVPTLVFAWDAAGQTWMLTNIGNGPALDVVILQRIGGQWVRPLRMPEMAVQDSNLVPTRWVGWSENPGLGARYRSITGERYMTKTGDDWSQQSRGWGDMPPTLWNQIEPHWRYDEPVSILDLAEGRRDATEPSAGGLDAQSNTLSQRGIAISYRREDAGAYAGRIYDDLASSFGPEHLFMDFATGPGLDWDGIASAGTLLVLIGPDWLGAKDSDGTRRVDDPRDPVRLVIEDALGRGTRVIPVLVRGARMPSAEELPEALAPLAWRHPAEIADSMWRSDMAQFKAALTKLLAESERSRSRPNG